MSLHATLTPAAQERLQSQCRTSTISSVIITLLATALLTILLLIIGIATGISPGDPMAAYQGKTLIDKPPVRPTVNTHITRKPSAPFRSTSRMIATNTSSPVAVPIPDDQSPNPGFALGTMAISAKASPGTVPDRAPG